MLSTKSNTSPLIRFLPSISIGSPTLGLTLTPSYPALSSHLTSSLTRTLSLSSSRPPSPSISLSYDLLASPPRPPCSSGGHHLR
ncbi:hypothetical protein Syun_020705 [Stephania yunnanensis]|uniref:Uncharacterized protein n=1 Tax=Stephania yunnanensis TaxID=152371 RepID=A0AAP0IEE5_9MAGN